MQVIKQQKRAALVAIMSCVIVLAGCATLPSNGPTAREINRDVRRDNAIGFTIVELAPDNIDALSAGEAEASALAALTARGDVDTLGPGDVLAIEIYEVGFSLFGGRASPGGGSSASTERSGDAPAARGETLNGVVVDRNGNINVPYAGPIFVAGLTPPQVERRIVEDLYGKSQSPQVVVRLLRNVANSVVVMGAVTNPGRVPLTLARERLLDVIAESGGLSRTVQTGSSTATGVGPHDVIVQFTRGELTARQQLDTIVPGSPDDLVLLGGDRIDLIRQPRTFTVFGAIDRVSQVPFESPTLTLTEALARAGGPNDARADPRAIYVFRLSSAVDPGGAPQPVVYRLNLKRAQGFFLAQRFAMRDKDVLYVANAAANQPAKLAQIIGLLFSPLLAVETATRR